MSTTVHILNGDSTCYSLQKSGLKGDRIVWRELLCDGPLIKDVASDEFWMLRYDFFEKKLGVDRLEYFDKIIKELIAIEDLSAYQEVVLWFEYDVFCQVNLMALCSYLLKHYKRDVTYYLVCVGREKGKDDWFTLADYSPEQYTDLYENKVKLSRNDLLFANTCWDVFIEGTKDDLEVFDFNKSHKFKYFNVAIKQHLKNGKEIKGLDQITYKILQVIDNEPSDQKGIIRALLHWQRKETVNGFGDLQYELRLNDLKDYYDVKDEVYILNTKGRELLA